MTQSKIKQRIIALFMLIVFSAETFYPATAYALTSGPSTPEMTSFEPASTANMVDMFSGDFSYNIPLLKVGDYPINLSYHSGSGPEDEASWVGFGWTLNPGAVNRQLRGLPDDFNGDEVTQHDNKKPNVTVGGNVNVAIKLFGNRLPKIKIRKKKKNLDGNMKVKIGIAYNNYTGYKGMIGIGTGFNTSDDAADLNTKNLSPTATDLSAGAGLNVDNQSGINPYANFDVNFKIKSKKERDAEKDLAKKNENYTKGLAEGQKFDRTDWEKACQMEIKALNKERGQSTYHSAASLSFAGFKPPSILQIPMITKNFTASLAFGFTLFGGTVAPGLEGTYSKQELKKKINKAPAYGFINSSAARSKEDALLDYNMEKESPYYKRLPNLGVPVFSPDLYNVSSHAGSMQFRPYLKGSGIFFQPDKHDVDKSTNLGLEPAFGNLFHIGVPLQLNKTNSKSGKWTSRNDYTDIGDFKSTSAGDPGNEGFYFKRVGEKNRQDMAYFSTIGNTSPVAVRLTNGASAMAFGNGKAESQMRIKSGADINAYQSRTVRDKANYSITYLTGNEANNQALQRQIPNYKENTLPYLPNVIKAVPVLRNAGYRKPHHISQYTITQDDGQRLIFGHPVYNVTQEEVSFAINYNATQLQKGIAQYVFPGIDNSIDNTRGKDNYFHKYITPSYTTGHLISAILSPDYVDITGDGITDDDMGSAVKFNYSLLSDIGGNPRLYRWRTPYTNENDNVFTANYNEGYKSIFDDDKANYVWGEKEIWYMHSIESKTMVAQFYTADRNDGIGVAGENGGKEAAMRLKRLTEIRLYSKSDLYANGANAVPIKTVHFEYDNNDPILNLVPNNVNGKGKLTLKRIWFTYGNNPKGQYHSYRFNYNIPSSQDYEHNQSDRWGTYKPKSSNPSALNNLEFPYATQNKVDADNFVSYWQLNQIELPSGAIINVQYESDDYAYVQDKRAMQMCFLTGIGNNGDSINFSKSDKFYVKLPVKTSNAELGKRYFDGLKSLAFKAYVDMDNQNAHYEYVSGYADILSYIIINPGTDGKGDIVQITVSKINGYNPLSKAAWQKLKLELPRYAYPEFDNLDADESGFIKAIKALGAAFGRFKDLVESFDARADRKNFGDRVHLYRSWVRLCTPNGINSTLRGKLGGGHRVKEIRINDQWSQMSGVATAENGSYGQRYEYTTEVSGPSGATETISSGVASYEPLHGGDEIPFREPVNYVDKHLFGQPKYFYLERPMGESYFPAPSVGYSKVTVKNLGSDNSVGANGAIVNEFYTARDFPTKVDELPMERRQPKLSFLPRLFGATITSAVTVSQGYVVENNDMHGKAKSEAVYGANGNELSSARYLYKVKNPATEKLDLDNQVSVAYKNGTIENNATVGMDIDMFTEMNESSMENMGVAVDPSFGIAIFVIIPKFSVKLPLPKPNYEKRLYRGSTTIKLVNRYAILDKVVKTVNGSTNTSENMLWDAETGEVLLSKTNNEYDESIYMFNYPAHWAYDGMGSSFKNEGLYLANFSTGAAGQVLSSVYNNILVPGDELVPLTTLGKYWVVKTNGVLRIIDKNGFLKTVTNMNLKVLRSGRRNLSMASIGTVATINNPIAGGSINFSQATKILQAKGINYEEYWPMPVSYIPAIGVPYTPADCSGGTSCICTCLRALFNYLINTNQLFIQQTQSITVGQLVSAANTAGYSVGSCSVLDNNLTKPFYALTTDTVSTVYKAQIGDCRIAINSTSSNPVSFYTLIPEPCGSGSGVTLNYSSSIQVFKTTIPVQCSQTATYNITFTSVDHSSTKFMVQSNMGPAITTYQSAFKIPTLVSALPPTASPITVDLFLYADPQGHGPGYPNAHTTVVEAGGLNRNGQISIPTDPVNCGSGWPMAGSGNGSVYVNPTNHFSDQKLDFKNFYTMVRHMGYNPEFIFFHGWPGTYNTYVSTNHPDVTKHPKVEIVYQIPVPASNVATLQVEECVANGCTPPVVNPYVTGLLGNWRTKKELVFDTKRVNNKGNVSDPTGTHLRNSGYFESFVPYWQQSGNNWIASTDPKWQWTTEVKKFNRKGLETEDADALNRHNAAQYGYIESVPVAVASNAMQREIGFDGFEDYNFNLGQAAQGADSCNIQDHFSFRKWVGTTALLDNGMAHSGKYSLMLNGTISLSKPLLLTEPSTIYTIDNNQYKIGDGFLRHGLVPVPSKKYILSGWINDNQPKSPDINGLTLLINGTTYNVNDHVSNPAIHSKVHVVEGWKRFEVVFTMPASGNFTMQMGGSNIRVDDIRIHPYDGQLKSFVYDASSMRLWAELDENNFATFYEYDDEGILIRVKKETEKGISTLKETRSSTRRKP